MNKLLKAVENLLRGKPLIIKPMVAKLTYFKLGGKYYTSGEVEVNPDCALFEIWADIETMQNLGKWPGLCEGQHYFITLVEVPGHKHEHPRLIMPKAREP